MIKAADTAGRADEAAAEWLAVRSLNRGGGDTRHGVQGDGVGHACSCFHCMGWR